jgi:hypothetical protein
MLNVIGLSIYDYSDRQEVTLKNKVIKYFDYCLTIIFVIESIMKVIAMGFIFHQNAYLRDGWNIIDFVTAFSRYA